MASGPCESMKNVKVTKQHCAETWYLITGKNSKMSLIHEMRLCVHMCQDITLKLYFSMKFWNLFQNCCSLLETKIVFFKFLVMSVYDFKVLLKNIGMTSVQTIHLWNWMELGEYKSHISISGSFFNFKFLFDAPLRYLSPRDINTSEAALWCFLHDKRNTQKMSLP